MAVELQVHIVDPDGKIYVTHLFYGKNEADAQRHYEAHLEDCVYFAEAVAEGRTIEAVADLPDSEWPKPEDFEEDDEDEEESKEEDIESTQSRGLE